MIVATNAAIKDGETHEQLTFGLKNVFAAWVFPCNRLQGTNITKSITVIVYCSYSTTGNEVHYQN